jgi:glycosyltransferase involved in cell wall biosynthesis
MSSSKLNMPSRGIKVGVFADDIGRKAMGTTLVLQRLVGEFSRDKDIDLSLIHKEGVCSHKLCNQVRTVPVKVFKLPFLSGFFSYLWFCVFTKERFDIIHFPRPFLYPFFWLLKVLGKTKKIVVTFHGAPESKNIPIYQTPANRFNRWFIILFGRFFIDSAIVVSQSAVEQVHYYYKISKNKIRVTYLGVDNSFRDVLGGKSFETIKKYNIKTPYILIVGRFDPHKNIDRAIKAYFSFKENNGFAQNLVIIGGRHEPAYSNKIEKLIRGSLFSDLIRVVSYVEDEDLPHVYNGADLLLFVSSSEGFGLPVIEAMASGTPVVASNISAMPEIAGGAAKLVDPNSSKAIIEGIKEVLLDKKLRDTLVQRGLKRSKEFTWRKTAESTKSIYLKTLNNVK